MSESDNLSSPSRPRRTSTKSPVNSSATPPLARLSLCFDFSNQPVAAKAHALEVEPLEQWQVVGPVEGPQEVVSLGHHLLQHGALLARQVVEVLAEDGGHDVL